MKNENKIIPITAALLAVLLGGYFLLRGDTPEQKTAVQQAPSGIDAANIKNREGYYDVNSAALINMLKNKDFPLVNVHIPYEGELANTDAFIPYNTIGQNLEQLPSDKNAKIVLYCRSGSMSAVAAKELAALGYTNVHNLIGGMNEWEKEGNLVIRK